MRIPPAPAGAAEHEARRQELLPHVPSPPAHSDGERAAPAVMAGAAAGTDADERLADEALAEAAGGGGLLGKLIGGFLVCYVCCGLSCVGGATALVVLGISCLGAESSEGGGSASGDCTPSEATQLLALGGVPLLLLLLCVTWLRLDDGGCCRPDYVSPNGLATRRKEMMLRRAGQYPDDDELDEELAASLGDMEGATAGGPTTPPGSDTRVVTRPGEDQDQAPVLPPSTE